MVPNPDQALELVVSRPRSFTRSKTAGLDFTTSSRIDQDFISHLRDIKSLPHEDCGTCTLYVEQPFARSFSCFTQSERPGPAFDFSTAKSVANEVHDKKRLSLPLKTRKPETCQYGCPKAVRTSRCEAQHTETIVAHRRICKLIEQTKRRDGHTSLRPYVFLCIFAHRAKEKVSAAKDRVAGQEKTGL